MIWNIHNSKGMKLVDCWGTAIPYAFEFNDETHEVKFFVAGALGSKMKLIVGGNELVKASAVVEGAKMVLKEKNNDLDE